MERKTRKPLRRDGADYSANGCYFITICTKDRKKIFWDMEQYDPQAVSNGYNDTVGAIINRPHCLCPLTACGKIAEAAVLDIPRHYPAVAVDHFVIMPNHIHLLLSITDADGRLVIAPTEACDAETPGVDRGRLVIAPTISQVVRQFKTAVTKATKDSLWQRSFHDRIIRNRKEYDMIAKYIYENPLRWMYDENYI